MSARVNFAKLMCITNYVYWLRAVKTSAEPITACVSKEAAYATEAVRGIKHTCGSVYQHSGAIRHRLPVNSAKTHTFLHAWTHTHTHTHTRGWWEDSVPGSRQAVPLFFCSMASCFSRVSLSSLSLNSSIFSSVFSSCTCFSWARALSIATLSRPCARTHTHTHTHEYIHTQRCTEEGESGERGKREWCGLFKSFKMKWQQTTLKVCHGSSLCSCPQ